MHARLRPSSRRIPRVVWVRSARPIRGCSASRTATAIPPISRRCAWFRRSSITWSIEPLRGALMCHAGRSGRVFADRSRGHRVGMRRHLDCLSTIGGCMLKRTFLFLAMAVLASAPLAAPKLLWETKGLAAPESVVYDSKRDRLLVSTSMAPRMRKTAMALSPWWIRREDTQPALGRGARCPKGTALYGDRLYIADLQSLVVADLETGKVVARYPARTRSFQRCCGRCPGQCLRLRPAGFQHPSPECRAIQALAGRRQAHLVFSPMVSWQRRLACWWAAGPT